MPKRNIIWVVAILAATGATLLVTRNQPTYAPTTLGQPDSPIDDMMERIKGDYYREIDDDIALQRGALRGIVEQLDEFSSFLPPSKMSEFCGRIDGFAQGLGIRTVRIDGHVEISDVAANSPARRQGLRPGMKLVRVDGVLVRSMDDSQLRRAIRPKSGDSVTLTLGSLSGAPRTVVLTSEQYNVRSVSGLLRTEDGRWRWLVDSQRRIAYIRISEFVNDTAERVHEALRIAGSVNGLILDLRDNPGGKMEVAVQVADMFLDDGLIVKMVGQSGVKARHEAHVQGTVRPMPMVVLVNEATASGAELLAGALWARHRAVLVGERTKGKGCVQTMIDMGDLGLVNLTSAQFVFSRGGTITRHEGARSWGLGPHVVTKMSSRLAGKLDQLRITAEYGPAEQPATRPSEDTVAKRENALLLDLMVTDRQLGKALELVRRGRVKLILADAKAEADRQATTQASSKEGQMDDD